MLKSFKQMGFKSGLELLVISETAKIVQEGIPCIGSTDAEPAVSEFFLLVNGTTRVQAVDDERNPDLRAVLMVIRSDK